jgi:hypothetical protein
MEVDALVPETDANEVNSGTTKLARQPTDLYRFGTIEGLERIVSIGTRLSANRSDFDCRAQALDRRQDVDFSVCHLDVPTNDSTAMSHDEPRRQILTKSP